MKRVFWSLLFLLAFAGASLAAPQEKFFHEGDVNTLIQLNAQSVAVIELWSNPSTGYGWKPRQPLDSDIRVLGSEFEPTEPGLKGAWGKEKIYVVGAAAGSAQLALEYRRSFENKVLNVLNYHFKTSAAFKETFSMPSAKQSSAAVPSAKESAAVAGLPPFFNWCDQNGCTPVRDQGNCGSCWAFATVGPLESLIKINDGVAVDLAEQYLVSCNAEGWGCDGGNWAHDYHQWKKVSGEPDAGAVLETLFPYQARDVTCNPPHEKAYTIDAWAYVCGSARCAPTTAQIKQAIYDHGPLTVAVCVNSAFQSYSGGVFTGPGCTTLNHGVVLVGWDDGAGCWIMRNSWGSRWGESGYMRIAYGVSGIGSEACYVQYSASPSPEPTPEPEPEPEAGEIVNGQTISNLSARRGDWLYYHVNVAQGASNLTLQISGGSGDADLYTHFSVPPTAWEYDCRPRRRGNNESCRNPAPEAGTWHIGLRARRSFSGVALRASYQTVQ